MPTTDELNGGFNLGEWEVLPSQGVLRRGEEEERPEPKVLSVLLALARRDGNLVSKDELIDEVWDGRAFGDEPIQRCIALLRKHLHDTKPFEYIETLQRRGYRLMKPVELHVAAQAANEPGIEEGQSVTRWRNVALLIVAGFVAITAVTWNKDVWWPRAPAVRSIAVMPIHNLSGDEANQYVVDGIKSTLIHQLSELDTFTIKNSRLDYDDPSSIARELNVESVLEGALQMQGEVLKVTWLITRGADGVTIGSGEVTGNLSGVFGLQERLARAVRDELAGSRTPELIERAEPDSVAYNIYLRGMYALGHRFDKQNLENAKELFEESIRLDESYGPAYLGLAMVYTLLPDYRGFDTRTYHDLAIRTIELGIEMDASIEDPAGAIYGFVYHQQKKWLESEANYQRAVSSSVVDSNAFNSYSRMLASVGRLEDALDMALAGEMIDPDSTVINSRIAMVYTWLDNTAKAHEYFERAADLDATGLLHVMAHSMLLARGGQGERSRDLSYAAAQMEGTPTDWIEPVYRAFSDPAYAGAALAAINEAWEKRHVSPYIPLVVRSLLGDVDGAIEIAGLLEGDGEVFSTELLFVPELAAVRQHPEFMPLLQRLGIVDYWNEVGCRWENDRVACQP